MTDFSKTNADQIKEFRPQTSNRVVFMNTESSEFKPGQKSQTFEKPQVTSTTINANASEFKPAPKLETSFVPQNPIQIA